MAVPEGATKLGTVGIAYKGAYNELQTYKYANAVYYNGSTYIALIDNPAGFPSNDGVNWRYLAQGFLQQAISELTVIDESGILGEVGAEVNAQEFLSKIAELEQGLEDTKANKADILESLEEIVANQEGGRIAGALAVKELNSNLSDVVALGNVKANESSSSVSLTLSQSLNNFKYVLLRLEADGYEDVKMFPVKILTTIGNISGRGYYLKVYSNDNYFCEVNVGFYSKTSCEVRTVKYAGWTGTVYVYGIK